MDERQKTKKTIEEVIKLLGIDFDDIEEGLNDTTSSPRFVIRTKESSILIGANGANLLALNHVVKKIMSKDKEEEIRFFIDVNDYHSKVEDDLKNRAKMMAERAISLKADVSMDPMSSYERMIVHSVLQGMPNIRTESAGVGRDRHIVIKYEEEENL